MGTIHFTTRSLCHTCTTSTNCIILNKLAKQWVILSSLCNAVYGIKWAHDINGLPDPTTNTFISSVLEASKRIAVKPTVKKEPISPDTLIELCNIFKDSVDLLIVRDLAMILLSFFCI